MLRGSSEETSSSFSTGLLCPQFPIAEIQSATHDFNERLLIGEGGFGKVYKGTIKNGTRTAVAIKRLDSNSDQGAPEFWAEVEMLSMLRHCNLVSLIGYCNDNKEMILVYEYMSNSSLEDHLHNLRTPLSWLQRLNICISAARGLHYFHTGTGTEQGVIHRDVKSSNILLDNNWSAKISDFGLSKISPINKTLTYVNTLIKGTFGYFDPEYFSTGRLTRKSDVFAFGVILLEVLCRKRAVDKSLDEEQWGLVGWAEDYLKGGKLKKIIDPELRGQISLKCLIEYAKIVDGCLQNRSKLRITMAKVVSGLESILALQERNGDLIPQKGITTFGRKLQKYFFTSEQSSEKVMNKKRGKTNPPSNVFGELVAAGWPFWLAADAGDALKGWLPRSASTFEKLNKIGEGSNSFVYKAREIPTGKVVALKKLRCDTSDPESVKMMAIEIAILRRLDHPNIIKLEGIVTSRMSKSLYLVFEYMDYDLASLSADPNMQFTDYQIKHYMHQLFSGLKYCHDHQVLHRDIKGSDLLLNNNGILKIADFGSASFFDLIHEQPLTNQVATFWYRAPELLLGATEYSVGIDLWSSSCILAGLLAKKPILTGHTEAEQLQKIYTLCGSPPDKYWKTYKLPLEKLYKPQRQFRRCITETFNDFPPSSLSLLDILLSIDPAKRQSAASALRSKFFSDMGQANESQSTEREDIGSMKSNTTSRGLGKQTERSVVRNHFTEFVDSYGKKICRCNYCAEEYDCASNFGTSTTLMNHIKSCASYPAHQTQTQSKFNFTATKVEETGEKNVSLLAWRFDQKVARKSITEMIIMDRLPFEFVENEGFRRCMKTCQPALVIPSLITITRDCYELFVDEKEKLKAQLNQSTIRVCLTIDTWTSLQRTNFLCLTAHFIDNNWKLQKKVINFCPISSRRGRDIGRAVELCLVDWGLQNIFTITVDNASSNDTAIDYLKNNVVKGGDLCLLKGKWTHVRSMTHVMNLVVRDLIKEMSSSVDRVRASVCYVRDSPAILKKFKEFVKLERIECQKSLCVDVPTRWNSTYLMLSVAIVYERAFDRLAIEDFVYRSILGEGCGVPNSFDWDNVKRLVGFLQQYYQLTLRVSGTKYITSNTFLDSISCIHSVFKECFSSEDDELREMSLRMKSKFDKYWGKNDKFNLLVFIASVFDPRTKFKYLEITLCNMYGDDDGMKIVALCRSALYELFHDYTRVHSHQHSSSQVRTQSYTSLAQSVPRSDEALSKLEMDRYLTEESEEDNEYFQSEDFTILDWWKRRSTDFPILSRVARDVLAIPISTVGYQSSFSTTTTKGNVLDLFTTSLTPKTIQALICYQDWMRSCDVPVNVEEHMQELNVFQDDIC